MHAQEQQKDKVSQLVLWGHWFTFFNMILAMLIATRYIATEGWPETLLGQGYLLTNLVGHFAFLGFAVYLLTLFPVTLLLPFSRILRGYAAVVATLGQSALLFDTLVFDHYRLHLNPFVLDVAASDLLALLNTPLLVAGPLLLFALQLVLANGLWKRLHRVRRRKLGTKVVGTLMTCFFATHFVHVWADATVYRPITQQDDMFPLHYPATAKSFMTRQGLVDEDSLAKAERSAAPTRQLRYPLSAMQCHPSTSPNILLVAVDAWRADMVDQQTMPKLLELAQSSHWFPRHFSGGNQYQSGLYSLLYGMLPAYEVSLNADKKTPVLIDQLAEQGYDFSLFGDPNLPNSRSVSAMLAPFHVAPLQDENNPAQQDSSTTDEVLDLLANANGPQFALVTYHAPAYYSTPVGSVGIPSVQADPKLNYAERVLYNQYRQSLHFLDGELNRLLSGVSDDTLVILTGTHGQVFTTDANVQRNFSAGATQVPMLIRFPGDGAWTATHQTSHYGLVGSLMTRLMGCENPTSDYSLGDNLYQPPVNPFLVMGSDRNFAIRTNKSITVIDKHGEYRVYSPEYKRRRDAGLDVQVLLGVMEEGRRFLAR
ncbi:DUF3413 domain-containing protein [Ferrimonas balearica]|uniref:DUF3413 domain-containing protein n=1 Tax=Ferrimonas balearica TaxID=44012 RepID=UPI001C56E697|nr:DUF3413 domain-containing protein [Ferrimonas balearica]MBW3138708.1 DUF3413 domain-containing protein [Ferrimonas balearica]MBW3163686.1 DUF3413 domain-containing protein [Ferrimonas balearica]MBY6105769.1 DUF3413 domain-containing protein [Ferrimonas balearica]